MNIKWSTKVRHSSHRGFIMTKGKRGVEKH